MTMPNTSPSEDVRFRSEDVELVARVDGAGPLVVLMHGFPDTWRTWDAMAAALRTAGFRTAALSLRGYAPSGIPKNGDYGLAVLAGDVVALLDRLGVSRAHVVGHDWGASAAYALAALHPDRVDRMVTLAIPPLAVFPSGWRERIARPHNVYLGWGAASAWLLQRDGGRIVDHLYRRWSPSWTALTDHLGRVRRTLTPPDRARAAVDYYAAQANKAEMAALAIPIRTPTLAIYGADEPVVRKQAFACAVHVLGPRSKVRELPGIGHWPHLEAPEEVARDAARFLQGDGTVI